MSSTGTITSKKNAIAISTAGVIAVAGLALASIMLAWVAGSLGISAAAASQVVKAIEVGGWALVAVAALFGFGVGGAFVATVRWLLVRKARNVVIA